MTDTSIEWTDATWNPVAGCAIVSSGCTNCYAMRMAARLEAMGMEKYRGLTRVSGGRAKWTGRIRCDETALAIPTKWRTPRKVFVNSMSDLFHPEVPADFVSRVWKVMAECPQHIFQILTKRPEIMSSFVSKRREVLQNVWLGTSIEDGTVLDRMEALKQTPAAIRFVSFEPLIGPVGAVNLSSIDWAIIGGESGPNARPMEMAWVDEIKAACDEAGTAFFFKQIGGVNKKTAGRIYRGRTWDNFPKAVGQLF
jgi:protein gp37